MTLQSFTSASKILGITLAFSVGLNVIQLSDTDLKGFVFFFDRAATDDAEEADPEPDPGASFWCGGELDACGGHCVFAGEVCQKIRLGSKDFVCGCDLPKPQNPCGGTPDACGGECARKDDVCRTLTDNDGTKYCTCFWEPQGTCGGIPDACSGGCPETTSCMTRTNESTGEKYCSCGHWTEDPQFTCDDKTENTCTEGKCPQDEVCISTIFLDGSFAGCGCSDPSPDTNLP